MTKLLTCCGHAFCFQKAVTPMKPCKAPLPPSLLSLKIPSGLSLTVRCMTSLNKTPLETQQSMWSPISSAFSLSKNRAEELQELLCQHCIRGLVRNAEQSMEEHWLPNKTVILRHFLTISTSHCSKSGEGFVQEKKTHAFFHVWRELSYLEKIICSKSLEPFSQ